MLEVKKIRTVAKFCLMIFMFMTLALPVAAQLSEESLGVTAVGDATQLGKKDLKETVGSIIKVALGFLGVVAIVVVLIGGFQYMVAGGNEDKVKKARGWIISGIIGLAIILSAYAITSFVVTNLLTATKVE